MNLTANANVVNTSLLLLSMQGVNDPAIRPLFHVYNTKDVKVVQQMTSKQIMHVDLRDIFREKSWEISPKNIIIQEITRSILTINFV